MPKNLKSKNRTIADAFEEMARSPAIQIPAPFDGTYFLNHALYIDFVERRKVVIESNGFRFEAYISETTVHIGGKQDVVFQCHDEPKPLPGKAKRGKRRVADLSRKELDHLRKRKNANANR